MTKHSFQWEPINDLPADWEQLAHPEVGDLVEVWNHRMNEVRGSGLLDTFLQELMREWAIETGVLERLYSITKGATRTLIKIGLDASLLSHGDTDIPPSLAVSLIRDQLHAINGLYEFVSSQRRLSKSYLCELHQVITAHQATCDVIDILGNVTQTALLRGAWKQWPNNIVFEDGSRFEFCPPEQVESEIERLLELHDEHDRQSVPPDVEAAWLHHRFTLIHPFQDGNGRIARCLATLVFLKEHWLPLVITRDQREQYFAALAAADNNELGPLVDLFANAQVDRLKAAMSLSDEVIERGRAVDELIESTGDALKRRAARQRDRRAAMRGVADELCELLIGQLQVVATKLNERLQLAGERFGAHISHAKAGTEQDRYYRYQIGQCAKALHYYANLSEYRAWVRLRIDTDVRTVLLFSIHALGWTRDACVVSAMFWDTDRPDSLTSTELGDSAAMFEVMPICQAPFIFTEREFKSRGDKRFRDWIHSCVVDGLSLWQKRL